MLNNAWPSVIWHLYDYYLRPGGGYSAPRKPANRCTCSIPTTIVDRGGQLALPPLCRLQVTAKVHNLDLSEKFSKL